MTIEYISLRALSKLSESIKFYETLFLHTMQKCTKWMNEKMVFVWNKKYSNPEDCDGNTFKHKLLKIREDR